jgi:hypothetical protein
VGEKSAASMAMLEMKSKGPHKPHLYAEQMHRLVPSYSAARQGVSKYQ